MLRLSASAQDWIRRFILHVLTGALAVAVHYGIMAALLHSGMEAVVASTIGFCGGALTRFLTAYYHVFSPEDDVVTTLPRFLASLAAQGLLNSLLLAAFIAVGMATWWAQISVTVLMTFLNYLVYRLWVFR